MPCLVLAQGAPTPPTALAQYPAPSGFVNDFAGILDNEIENGIEAKIAMFTAQYGGEIAVLTMPTLNEMPIEEFSAVVFKKWGIGKELKDNGVLVVVALKERTGRIEIGYGYESILNDAKAGEIIRGQMIPNFKNGDYNKGVEAAVDKIMEVLIAGTPATDSLGQSPEENPIGRFMALTQFIFGFIF